MQADADIFFHSHLVKEADVLEGTGDAQTGGLNNAHAVQILPVDQYCAGGGLIDLGQEIEDGGLSGAVRADKAGDLRFADGQVEIVNRLQAAELDAQMAGLHDRDFIDIPLGNDGMGRHRDHFGIGTMFLWLLRHLTSPPPAVSPRFLRTSFFAGEASLLTKARVVGLLVKIMTRISTTA